MHLHHRPRPRPRLVNQIAKMQRARSVGKKREQLESRPKSTTAHLPPPVTQRATTQIKIRNLERSCSKVITALLHHQMTRASSRRKRRKTNKMVIWVQADSFLDRMPGFPGIHAVQTTFIEGHRIE